ncbi:RNA polymerase sigma-70 factor [Dysgonomonas sp. Marseille-P4677]|uniref:RNA polymerase sigma-70 factor n=1 Tax=Dysgonomonas sp. Marseille-P4677 TaxID=2364790 RepID=UPI001911A72E|nr:RNA polymerase sigma-70 factor [Dysgonomonas sp. Marseille-P4677]MBK5721978.1 RNA polymerase sigma-70 factor [Dysgonomonas sp. Marseille-P4677]
MIYKEETDKHLAELLSKGDENAFCELYIRYKKRLFSFTLKFLKDRDLTEDTIQDIFTHLWESRFFIDSNCNFSSYLFTITKNRILNILKRYSIEENIMNLIMSKSLFEHTPTDNEIIDSEYKSLFKAAVNKLPPVRKKVFVLSRIEHMSHREIATTLNISIYTVQEHISESLKSIKRYLSSHTDIHFCLPLLFLFY